MLVGSNGNTQYPFAFRYNPSNAMAIFSTEMFAISSGLEVDFPTSGVINGEYWFMGTLPLASKPTFVL